MVDAAASSILGVDDGELALRICGPTRRGQVVRLKSRKCTIGSGPRCTLRLRARRVRPLHCLVLRGAADTVVRRWAPDTRLNGRAFTDAKLTPGDRLSIGPIEFEVLDPAQLPEDHSDPQETPSDASTGQLDRQEKNGAERGETPEARQRGLGQKDAALDDREEALRQQEEALRTRQAALDRQEAAFVKQAKEIDRAKAALEAEKQAFAAERSRATAGRLSSPPEAETGPEAAEARQQELQARGDAFDQQRQGWDAERAELQRQLRDRTQQLESRQAELEAQQKALQDERQQWTAERVELRRKLDLQARKLDEAQAAVAEKLLQADRQSAAPAAGGEQSAVSGQPEGDESQKPAEQAPRSSEEVLRQIGGFGPAGEEPSGQQQPAPPDASLGGVPDGAETSSGSGGGEESIDDYMARLLERVRETTSRPAEPARKPRSSSPAPAGQTAGPPPAPEIAGAAKPPPLPEAPEADSAGPGDMTPRAVAPEKSVDLGAMRDLANFSAQSAIDRHSRKVLSIVATGKLLSATVALAVSAAILAMWWFLVPNDLMLCTGLAILIIALFWGMQFMLLVARVLFRRRVRAAQMDRGTEELEAEAEIAWPPETESEQTS